MSQQITNICLYINGLPVCAGPTMGDLVNWFYETVDLAPYMNKGKNIVAAQVWNMGKYKPGAQISNQTAFLLQGDSLNEQALITLYLSGDDRIVRKCIIDFHNSCLPEGLTQSRYPSKKLQVIPAFSLSWVSMIYDYWMYKKDNDFVMQFLPAIFKLLSWFAERMDKETKMLGPLTWWNFVDWDYFNSWGSAPGAENGNSAIVSLQLAYTLKQAANIFKAFGHEEEVSFYRDWAEELNIYTYLYCFEHKWV